MSKEFDKAAAKFVAAMVKLNDESDIKVVLKTTRRAHEIIILQIPQFLEKSNDFHRTLLDLDVSPSVIFSTNKTKRNLRENSRAYIVYITNNKIDKLSNTDLKALLNSLDQRSKKISDVAPFIHNLFITWNQSDVGLRTHRELTEDMVRGYLKQLKTYSHREILDMVEDYFKWARAHKAMVDAEEYKPVWFPNMSLSGLLLSNKIFKNHLEVGWKQLVRIKGIPADYLDMPNREKPETAEDLEAKHQKLVLYIAQDLIKYGSPGMPHIQYYGEHKAEIDAKVEELKNAS